MKKSNSHLNGIAAFSAVAALLSASVAASASVVTLTGGDSTDGLSLNPANVVYAVYTPSDSSTDTSTLPFQGVTFTAAAATAGVSGVPSGYLAVDGGSDYDTAMNAGFSNPSSPSTDDTQLLALENAGLQYNGGSIITLTFSGLANSTNYRVDSINSLIGYSQRTNNISYNGSATVSDTPDYVDDSGTSSSHEILNIDDTVESTAGTGALNTGSISITYAIGTDGPFYNAVVISAIPTTPEPSTWAMILGGMGPLAACQCRRLKALNTPDLNVPPSRTL